MPPKPEPRDGRPASADPPDLFPGRATAAGTRRFAERAIAEGAAAGHFRRPDDLSLSSLGLGTRRGEPGGVDDLLHRQAVAACIEGGCNVFDSALSDRVQTSQRAVGTALQRALRHEGAVREELIVIAQGGFLTPEPNQLRGPGDARRNLIESYLDTGLVDPSRLVGGNSLDAAFHVDQIQRSRHNLGLATIDFYLVQEPEQHLGTCEPAEFRRRLIDLFEALEHEARAGRIGGYGLCSWSGLLTPFRERHHLSLVELFDAALAAGSADHHLRALQLPFGLASAEAAALGSQLAPDATAQPVFDLLADTGTAVFASAPLYSGRVLGAVPGFVREAYPEARSEAQCCLQFTRSSAGVHCAVVGMRDPDHVDENLALARIPPASPAVADRLLDAATGDRQTA